MYKDLFKTKRVRPKEEADILNSIAEVRENMRILYERMNYTSDHLMSDSLAYELLALKNRHRYFIEKAKELKITR